MFRQIVSKDKLIDTRQLKQLFLRYQTLLDLIFNQSGDSITWDVLISVSIIDYKVVCLELL